MARATKKKNSDTGGILKQFASYKKELTLEVRRQSDWHARKFKQRRKEGVIDTRLEIGAEVLGRVADQLDMLPADHPRIREAWRRWYGLTQSNNEESEHEVLLRTVLLQEFYVNYGFNWEDANIEKFLDSYLDALTTAGEILPQ